MKIYDRFFNNIIVSIVSVHHIFFCLLGFLICSSVITRYNLHRISFITFQKSFYSDCFQWESTNDQHSQTYTCPDASHMIRLIWTYDGSGLMKYIQWIITRKLANIRITELNEHCHITRDKYFLSDITNQMFIQVYIISLLSGFTNKSACSAKIDKNLKHSNQIYFKRKSLQATFFYQQLDQMIFPLNTNSSFKLSMTEMNDFSNYFTSDKLKIINEEDLIKDNLDDIEKVLQDFLTLLGVNIPIDIIKYDSHQFLEDATWWDQSDIAETILSNSIPTPPLNLSYKNDYYHLHGNKSFLEYLYRTRQCYKQGIFPQMIYETRTNRTSTDKPERCSSKPFDCAFSDIYSFDDREQIYQHNDTKSIKCGFTVPSIFDKIRNRYGRNHTCETIIFTLVTNCYDPLPTIKSQLLSSFCFVALVDAKTVNAYKKFYSTPLDIPWDVIDLGNDATPFSVAAKSTETLKIVGHRMFPLAKWIIWLDGKAHIHDIIGLLIQARAPVIGLAHPDRSRTSASEVQPTVGHLSARERGNPVRLNTTICDIKLQEQEYKRDGFYNQSDRLGLKMYDIAIFLYRNHHPCIYRYLCGWHNEVNYYSYRGQLSVYYSAVRFNLTSYLHVLPQQFYKTVAHHRVC